MAYITKKNLAAMLEAERAPLEAKLTALVESNRTVREDRDRCLKALTEAGAQFEYLGHMRGFEICVNTFGGTIDEGTRLLLVDRLGLDGAK